MRSETRLNSETPKRIILALTIVLALVSAIPASAQTGGPVYIVQAGDTLSFIASRFNVPLDDLIAANPTIDPNFLTQGQRIVIPGLEGITGVLETEIIAFGDTLRSLSRRTQVSDEQLIQLNRLVSPSELYAGISVILPVQEGQITYRSHTSAAPGESLLELAVRQGSDPWTLSSINKLDGTWDALPNDVLYSPSGNGEEGTGLPSAFLRASIAPLPLVQGGTEVIRVQVKEGYVVSGTLVDRPLRFFPFEDGQVALQGIHALLETGVYPLRLEATLPDGTRQSFEQMVLVTSGNYSSEELYVEPATIDPTVTEPENQQIYSITNLVTSAKYWNGIFSSPAVYPDQYTSLYGTRRIYKGLNSDLTATGFHTGLDFAGGEGLQIFAPAPGQVVFAGALPVRGNATIIDHGWGVYSGFWHQSTSYVNTGEFVEQGQVIGLVGGTGRVTGPHLHWEVWVNGVQVNPLSWLNQAYP
ncbi:MAG: peptidoglycan DD-metalloendopeptidase family protein [Chloroflexi bacterium]|nr:peptidoglycan DD-metalloendopeptidase family protein [Chloroflexota bacterium]